MRLSRSLATGTQVEQEGVLLCGVMESGVEKASLVATVAGAEKVIGFAYHASALPTRTSEVEIVTVPASGTLEVDLRNKNLVLNQVNAVDLDTAAPLTEDFVFAGAPGAGVVKIDAAAGKLKFHAGQAGHKVQVTYLYDLTFNQAVAKFGQRSINNQGLHEAFGQIEIGCGNGELYTDQFNGSVDYTSGPLTLGDMGIITVGGAGPALKAVVCNIPSTEIPVLGVRFTFGA
jgi:hypothetical protein